MYIHHILFSLATSVRDICKTSQKITDKTGYITTPGFPAHYAHNLRCNVEIQNPEADGYTLYALTFDLEDDKTCRFDSFLVKSGNTQRTYCGQLYKDSTALGVERINGRNMVMTFISDGGLSREGFLLKYEGKLELVLLF